jgi:hypothetical protein
MHADSMAPEVQLPVTAPIGHLFPETSDGYCGNRSTGTESP